LREFDQEIVTSQGRVAVISFARPEHLKRFAKHLGHPYLWLADPERRSYRHFGLRRRGLMSIAPPHVVWEHLRFALAGKIWHPEQVDVAQMGGDFVFDRRGMPTLEYLSSSSDDRPSVETVMAAFRGAASTPRDER
jgi:hypothetical protein